MELLINYGIFLAKLITILLGLAFLILMLVNAVRLRDKMPTGTMRVVHLNRRLQQQAHQLRSAVLTKKEWKQKRKKEKKEEKLGKKQKQGQKKAYSLCDGFSRRYPSVSSEEYESAHIGSAYCGETASGSSAKAGKCRRDGA